MSRWAESNRMAVRRHELLAELVDLVPVLIAVRFSHPRVFMDTGDGHLVFEGHLGLVGEARVEGFLGDTRQTNNGVNRGGGIALSHEGVGGHLDDAVGQQQRVAGGGAASFSRM